MKYKKVLTFLFTIFLALCLVGCGNVTTEKAVAKNIDKSTAKLDSVITALDDLNYDDIVIDDISPLSDSTFSATNTSNLQKTKWYAVGNGKTGRYLVKPASQKPSEQNAKYVSSQSAEKIGLSRQNDRNINDCPECEPNYVSNTTKTRNTNSKNTSANYSVKQTSTYSPKYVNEVSDSFTRNGLDNYLNKIEIVYNTCADCISCNAEIKNEKSKLKQNINECKTLSSKLKDGTIKLTDNEIYECNSCINSISACTSRLNSTKENLALKERDVAKLKDNLSKNLSNIQDAYEKLLVALESRLNYLKDCNNNICSLCDIINKSNVDMKSAQKNRSNEQDIINERDKLLQEQNNTNEDIYLDGSTPIVKNKTINKTTKGTNVTSKQNSNGEKSIVKKVNNTNSSSRNATNQSNASKTSQKNTNLNSKNTNLTNSNNKNTNKTITSKNNNAGNNGLNKQRNQVKNNDILSNGTNKTKSNIEQNIKPIKKPWRDNLHEYPDIVDNGQKINDLPSQNMQKDNQNGQNSYKSKTDNQNTNFDNNAVNPNMSNVANPNLNNNTNNPNLNNNVANPNVNNQMYNDGVQNPYAYNGYGYNGPFNNFNRPYPPRNIDTYHNIVKNIDTYSPNYLPGNGQSVNGLNNGILKNNSSVVIDSNNNNVNSNNNTDIAKNNDMQENLVNNSDDSNIANNEKNLDNNQAVIEADKQNQNQTQTNQNMHTKTSSNITNLNTMQNFNNQQRTTENTEQNTTMQNQNNNNLDNKKDDIFYGSDVDEKF